MSLLPLPFRPVAEGAGGGGGGRFDIPAELMRRGFSRPIFNGHFENHG